MEIKVAESEDLFAESNGVECATKEMKLLNISLLDARSFLTNSEYLSRNNRAPIITAVTLLKECKLVGSDMACDTVGTRNSVEKRKRKTLVGFQIPSMQNHNDERT